MERLGILLTFRPEVTQDEAEAALAALDGLVDSRIIYPHTKLARPGGVPTVVVDYDKPETVSNPAAMLQHYDDKYGGPTWYIP